MNVRTSMVSDTLEFVGKLATKLPIFAGATLVSAINPNGGAYINRVIGYAAGKASGRAARATYNKLVCENCNHVWDNPKSIWED